MELPLRILHLEDEPNDVELVKLLLDQENIAHEVVDVDNDKDFTSVLEEKTFDIIFADYSLPSFDGITALKIVQEKFSNIPFIFVSGAIGEERAIETLKNGATDYVLKQRMSRLIPSLQRALKEAEERRERIRAQKALKKSHDELEIKVKQRTAELEKLSQELARSNNELQQFAYAASHDLKAPLRNIVQFSELLEKKCRHIMDEKTCKYLNIMQGAGKRMTELVDNLLKYARVGAAKLNVQPVKIDEVIQQVLLDLNILIQEKNAYLEIEELEGIDGDPVLLGQLFQNLITNALKFNRQDVDPVITISGERLDQVYQITVRDNGIGFEQAEAERIFDAFQRLHGVGEYEGSGIGLTTCHKIMQLHGGTISAQGNPGKGATFIIQLPLKKLRPKSDIILAEKSF